jgi:hypothetical protein
LKIIGLDISTKTGWSLFQDGQLISFGLIEKDKSFLDYGEYPSNFILVTENVVTKIEDLIDKHKPDLIVIEETNKTGRFGSRHAQKCLEFLHFLTIKKLHEKYKIVYVNTSEWRRTLKLSVYESKKQAKPYIKQLNLLKKEFTKANKQTKKALKIQIDTLKKDLKAKCIHGKIDKKSISVAYVNLTFNLSLKKGDNDQSDAICLVKAYLNGAKLVSNQEIFESSKI